MQQRLCCFQPLCVAHMEATPDSDLMLQFETKEQQNDPKNAQQLTK
jgi:hypothetical protein